MATFQKIQLGDLLEKKIKVEIKKGLEYSFVPMENVDSSSKYPKKTEMKIFSGSGSKFADGDTLFARITPCLQNKKIVKAKNLNNGKGFGSTEFFILRAKKNVIDPDYLYYIVKQEDLINTAILSMTGASGRQRADINSIYKYEVNVPDRSAQALIASTLSAYDDLIENNERRIKILEETAQRLYEEWFVKYKFPGHEKSKMIDSQTEYGLIPEGWKIRKFVDFFKTNYGKNLPTSMISIEGRYKVYGAGGVIGYYNKKNVDTRTALVTSRGNGSGTVWKTFGEGFVTNNSFTVISKDKQVCFEFVFNCLRNCNILSSVSGSAQPQITIENINFVKLVLPPIGLIKEYAEKTEMLYDLSDKLLLQNQNLSKTRDLLIPQLVTGKRGIK